MEKKIAYIILAHNDILNLKRLVEKLDYNSDFYIHLDSKCDIKGLNIKNSNVKFIENRFDIKWAGFTMVEATKELIREVLKSKENYSHVVLLSGSDYPLKNKKEIYDFFMRNQTVEFIRGYKINTCPCKKCKEKITRYWFNDLDVCKYKVLNKIIRKILFYTSYFKTKDLTIKTSDKIIEPCFGSQWWALTPKCLQYIIEYTEKYPEIDEYFKTAYAPDEIYFHTLVFNSLFAKNTIKKGTEEYSAKWKWENLHYLDSRYLGCKLHYEKQGILNRVFNKREGSTSFYNEDSIKSLINSKQIFIRKVKTGYSDKLLDYLDKNIHKKEN